MTMRISKDRIDMDDKVLQKSLLKDYGETLVTANSSTSYTVDLQSGNVFNITLTGNCAFTFANPPASGNAGSFTLLLTQDSTGSRTVTWPSAVKWPSDTAPTLYTTAGSLNIYTFLTINGGTLWFGANAQGIYVVPNPYLPYGYFGGGARNPIYISNVDRIDYSNDTATATVEGPLSKARAALAGVGTSTYGYFAGGLSPIVSTIDRVDYSNDTATATAKGPLSAARYGVAGTGNSSYGYFGGGKPTLFSVGSTIDRLDYANDTNAAVAKGPLSGTRYMTGSTGNTSYGYFGGGNPFLTTVNRIDYANDTTAAAVKGPLSLARRTVAATGTSPYGYFGGGYTANTPAITSTSIVDRIDYANDTATAVAKGPLGASRYGYGASGNSSYGYFGGGSVIAPKANVYRIDYSNDTATATAKGPLSSTRYLPVGTNHGPSF